MKRIAIFMLLVAFSLAGSISANAKRITTQESSPQSRKAAKNQQKMLKRAGKKQRKAMKRSAKAQRRETRKANRRVKNKK